MNCRAFSRSILVVVFALLAAGARPALAVCLANGKACGVSTVSNDRLCCPGSICGPWGNVCQPGCRIGGVAYRAGTINPASACQVCQPSVSTTAWSSASNGTACSDGNACTQSDTCQSGVCRGANPVACSASDPCHVAGTCNLATGVCSNPAKPNGTACNDGSACTQSDTCQAGVCTGANPVVCPASDPCHAARTCNPATGVCSNPAKPNGTACGDGNSCTQSDTCQAGVCTGANPVVCSASDQCHVAGICNPASGTCSNPNAHDGTTCNDQNACTLNDSCQGGVCQSLVVVLCVTADQCHTVGTCNPATGVCSSPAKPDGTACDDSSACTQTDTCQSGACTGSSSPCLNGGDCSPVGTASYLCSCLPCYAGSNCGIASEPVAFDDESEVTASCETQDQEVQGNVIDNDDLAGCASVEVTKIRLNGVEYAPDSNGVITVQDAFGTLVIARNGNYTYTIASYEGNLGDQVATFTYTITNSIGNSSNADIRITLHLRCT